SAMTPETGTILFADDESTIRSYVGRILRREGFELLEAVDGADALQKLQNHGSRVDLLLTDIRMPRMDGVELAGMVTEMYPGTPVVYMSGYPFTLEQERTQDSPSACAFVPKPFDRKALLEAVLKCLAPPADTEKVQRAQGG